MAWLLDTNVVSELYKRDRGSNRVREWIAGVSPHDLFVSVLVLGEIRRGVELIRPRDKAAAESLESWLYNLKSAYSNRILPISEEICDLWGSLSVKQRLPDIDGLLAATAIHHGLILATRNTRDIIRSGVSCFDPFTASSSP